MSLRGVLEETAAASVNRIPAEALEVIMKSTAELDAQGVGNNALGLGDKLPDATLVDANNESVSMASLLAKGPLIINYYQVVGAHIVILSLKLISNYCLRFKHWVVSWLRFISDLKSDLS